MELDGVQTYKNKIHTRKAASPFQDGFIEIFKLDPKILRLTIWELEKTIYTSEMNIFLLHKRKRKKATGNLRAITRASVPSLPLLLLFQCLIFLPTLQIVCHYSQY